MRQIQRRSLVDQVTDELLSEIGSGSFPVGSLLPNEQHLAAHFSVSRTVVREAVAQLRAEGVISTVQGRGTYVASSQQPAKIALSLYGEVSASLIKIVELRRGLEGEAAKLAAERRLGSHVDAMRQLLDRMDSCLDGGDLEGLVEADIAFHREIFIAADNEFMLEIYKHVMNLVKGNIYESRKNSNASGINPLPIQGEHLQIFEAIESQDAEGALQAARRHMDLTAQRLTERVERTEVSD